MQKLSEHIYFVEGENGGKYPFCNCLLIKDEKSCLIDTGAGRTLKELKLDTSDFILNSHWHEDHIAYNGLLDSKICVHELDAEAAESFDEFKRRYGLPDELVNLFIKLWFEERFKEIAFSGIDVRFGDGEEFELGETVVRAIHTPGHSAGHSCFLIQNGNFKLIYLGDIDLTSFGPWYGCLDCNVEEFVESITRVMKIVDDEEVELVISSHKGVVSGKEKIVEGLKSYLEKIQERENKILNLLSSEESSENLVGKGIVYWKFPEPQEIFRHFETVMVEKHLERLVKKGRVARLGDGFVRI